VCCQFCINNVQRCSKEGVSQATADFSDCVSGNIVTDFGVGYDFKSVMHYPLNSLAVNNSIPTMIPKDKKYWRGYKDIGRRSELSEMDIKKLNYGYFCEGPQKGNCGGSFYSATGGEIKGDPVEGPFACEFVFRTVSGLGIELKFEETFSGKCSEDFLEIWVGGHVGKLFARYCKDRNMPKSVKVPANAVLIVWHKKTSSASSKGLWATYNVKGTCCNKIVMNLPEVGFQDNLFLKVDEEMFGGRNVYKFIGEQELFLFWTGTWFVAQEIIPPKIMQQEMLNDEIKLFNQVLRAFYCPENLDRGWSSWAFKNGVARCSDCDLYPTSKECVLQTMKDCLGSSNTSLSVPEYPGKNVVNYYKTPFCRFSNANGDWVIGSCDKLSETAKGLIYGNTEADCVNEKTDLKVAVDGTLLLDSTFKIVCDTEIKKPCAMCKSVLNEVTYKLKRKDDPWCEKGCLYHQKGGIYYSKDGEKHEQLQCPAIVPPML